MAKKFPAGLCVHCLVHHNRLTSDHVFPRSWYPDSTPGNLERWQVPACEKCNRDYGKLEENLLYRIGMCVDDDAPESRGIGTKVAAALNPARAKNAKGAAIRYAKAKKLLAERKLVDGTTKFESLSSKPGNALMMVDSLPLRKLCEKIIRGLIWINLGRFVDSSYDMQISVTGAGLQDFDQLTEGYAETFERGPGIEVKWAKLPEDPICGLYRVRIFGKIVLRDLIIPSDAKGKMG